MAADHSAKGNKMLMLLPASVGEVLIQKFLPHFLAQNLLQI